jgi:hypothetical protein
VTLSSFRGGLVQHLLSRVSTFWCLGDSKVIFGVFGEEFNERFKAAVTFVVNELPGTSGLELEGRESFDLEGGISGNIVISSVHLSTRRSKVGLELHRLETKQICSHGNLVTDGGETLGEFEPCRSEALAVTAPGSEELDEDILLVIVDDLLEFRSDEIVDRFVIGGRNRLALQGGFDLTSNEAGDEVFNNSVGRSEGLIERELGHFLELLDSESRVLSSESERPSVVTVLESVNPDEVDLALVLLGNGPDGVNEGVLVIFGGVDEEIGERKTGASVVGIVLSTDFVNERKGVFLDESLEVLGGGVDDTVGWEVVAALIEGLVEDDGGRSNTSSLNGSGVGGETEEVVITVLLSDSREDRCGGFASSGNVSNSDDLVSLGEFFVVGSGDLADSWQGLPN